MYPHSIAWQGIQYVLSPFFVGLTAINVLKGARKHYRAKKIITGGCWDYRNALTWLFLFWCINEVTMFFLLHTFLAIRVSNRCIATWSPQFRDTLGLDFKSSNFTAEKSYCRSIHLVALFEKFMFSRRVRKNWRTLFAKIGISKYHLRPLFKLQ